MPQVIGLKKQKGRVIVVTSDGQIHKFNSVNCPIEKEKSNENKKTDSNQLRRTYLSADIFGESQEIRSVQLSDKGEISKYQGEDFKQESELL